MIKIYGLPRTCTNITQQLLQQNFTEPVSSNTPDWKHGKCSIPKSDPTKIVLCIKSPYSWLESFYRYENARSLMLFLTSNTKLYKNMDPISAYNELMPHWLNRISTIVYQEDLITPESQIQTMKDLEKELSLERSNDTIKPCKKAVGPNVALKNTDYSKPNYNFTSAELDYINHRLDHSILHALAYPVIEKG